MTIIIGFISDVILPYVLKFKDILRIGIPVISIQSLCIFMAVKKYNFYLWALKRLQRIYL